MITTITKDHNNNNYISQIKIDIGVFNKLEFHVSFTIIIYDIYNSLMTKHLV